jgi:hypothetical protein
MRIHSRDALQRRVVWARISAQVAGGLAARTHARMDSRLVERGSQAAVRRRATRFACYRSRSKETIGTLITPSCYGSQIEAWHRRILLRRCRPICAWSKGRTCNGQPLLEKWLLPIGPNWYIGRADDDALAAQIASALQSDLFTMGCTASS